MIEVTVPDPETLEPRKAIVSTTVPHTGVWSDTGEPVEVYYWRLVEQWRVKTYRFTFCRCLTCEEGQIT